MVFDSGNGGCACIDLGAGVIKALTVTGGLPDAVADSDFSTSISIIGSALWLLLSSWSSPSSFSSSFSELSSSASSWIPWASFPGCLSRRKHNYTIS